MRILRTLIGIVCFFAFAEATPVIAQQSANPQTEAFGLRFGDDVLDARSKGLRLTIVDDLPGSLAPFSTKVGPFKCYPNVHRLPVHPTTTGWAQLCFSPEVGLQKILWAGKQRHGDPTNVDHLGPIKQEYRAMQSVLRQKYGMESTVSEPKKIDSCLDTPIATAQSSAAFNDCYAWYTKWRGVYGSVHLEMVVFYRTGMGFKANAQAGYTRLTYVGPSWDEAWEQFRAADADAF